MMILGLSGSLRAASTNTALLRAAAAGPQKIRVFDGLAGLPAFSPDLEGDLTPQVVLDFAAAVASADGLIVACPEYVHALPGAFKNALDWLVSREELTDKPIALLHASHRGEDVLADLRRILATVSSRFAPEIFARFVLNGQSPEQVAATMRMPAQAEALRGFLEQFRQFVAAT
ncbi:MAG: NADPH-dependent FMN reductase [bacterium]